MLICFTFDFDCIICTLVCTLYLLSVLQLVWAIDYLVGTKYREQGTQLLHHINMTVIPLILERQYLNKGYLLAIYSVYL